MNFKVILPIIFLAATPVIVTAQTTTPAMQAHGSMSPSTQAYMSGMDAMQKDMMDGIKDPDADKAFAKGMKAHHQGAIAMAETELKYGKDPEMRKLARDIIKAQKAEIQQMEDWLKK